MRQIRKKSLQKANLNTWKYVLKMTENVDGNTENTQQDSGK